MGQGEKFREDQGEGSSKSQTQYQALLKHSNLDNHPDAEWTTGHRKVKVHYEDYNIETMVFLSCPPKWVLNFREKRKASVWF